MYKHLTAADRGAIEVLFRQKYTVSDIAKAIGFHKSTVGREINHRSTSTGYSAVVAQTNSRERKKNSHKTRKLDSLSLQKYVVKELGAGWSPEQIASRLKEENNDQTVICHETIYH